MFFDTNCSAILLLEDGTYLLIQAGDNIKIEQAVGTVFSGRPIPN